METINAFEVERDHTFDVDLCIIGGGAAGFSIAKELINTPYNILLLESGGYNFDEKTQSLYDFESIGHPLRSQDGYVSRNRYLGGSTNTWAGRCAPLNDIDFEYRDWVSNSGWPIKKADLDEYYRKASEVLKLPNPKYFYARDWERYVTQYQQDYLDGDILHPAVFLFASEPVNMRLAYVQQLHSSSNIRICINANVTEIEPDESLKTIRKVHVASLNGNSFSVKSKQYILACGGWENARLLLLSRRYSTKGLGNEHDVVGRYYMEHPKVELGTITPSTKMLKSPIFLGRKPIGDGMIEVGVRLSERVQRQEKLLNHYTAMSPIYDGGRISEAIEALKAVFRTDGKPSQSLSQTTQNLQYIAKHFLQIPNAFRKSLNIPLRFDGISILNHFEHAPNWDSRIMLSNERDALGLNRLKVDFKISSEEKRCIVRVHEILGQVLKDKGIGELFGKFPDIESSWAGLTDSSHHMGVTRMSNSPKEGVVDKNCQVHGINNLYIASCSVFSTAGHVNPTLTIVAIALRLADHLKNKVLPKNSIPN